MSDTMFLIMCCAIASGLIGYGIGVYRGYRAAVSNMTEFIRDVGDRFNRGERE